MSRDRPGLPVAHHLVPIGVDEGPDGRYSLALASSHHNRITESSFGASSQNILLVDSDNNFIADNESSGGDTFGVVMTRSDRNVVRRNRVENEVGAVMVSDSVDNLIADNLARFGSGIVVRGSDRTKLRYNEVGLIEVTSSADAVLVGNVTAQRGWYDGDGILLSADSPRARLSDNRADGFSEDGFQIDAPGTVLTRNVANMNGDLGIEAVAGVLDGGGNQASGNGNPLQCTNVACAPSGA